MCFSVSWVQEVSTIRI